MRLKIDRFITPRPPWSYRSEECIFFFYHFNTISEDNNFLFFSDFWTDRRAVLSSHELFDYIYIPAHDLFAEMVL